MDEYPDFCLREMDLKAEFENFQQLGSQPEYVKTAGPESASFFAT